MSANVCAGSRSTASLSYGPLEADGGTRVDLLVVLFSTALIHASWRGSSWHGSRSR